ncbi:hypothetical protein SAMN05444359_106120 [Neolewinella agarilytica]|uniref:Uncharacterized protein n=1 Tax=Neolewinella agarilytica TaxID=478744 RepID=A0A1H9DSY0_9BACT|nr:hypothetical protein SAMN05444359_106120 [Neolewinella agarilytica]
MRRASTAKDNAFDIDRNKLTVYKLLPATHPSAPPVSQA